MTTKAVIEAAVYDWVFGATGVTTIFQEQGRPRPATPYCSVKMGNVQAVGMDDHRKIDDNGVQTVRGDREVIISVQTFGLGAVELARAAARALATENTRVQLAMAGLCPRGIVPTVNELTELLETSFEERAQFDATLALGEDFTEDVGLIEHVEGQGTFENPPNPDLVVQFSADKP